MKKRFYIAKVCSSAAVAVVYALLLFSHAVFADEFVLLNIHATITEPWQQFQNVAGATGPNIPKNWLSPVDYINGGKYYTRFVIHSMGNGKYPFDKLTLLCTIRDNPGLDDCHILEDVVEYKTADIGTGTVHEYVATYRWMVDFWWDNNFHWDTEPATRIRTQPRIFVHDCCHRNHYVDISTYKSDFNAQVAKAGLTAQQVKDWVFPMVVDYQAVLVSKGATFSGWENYPFKSGLPTNAQPLPSAQNNWFVPVIQQSQKEITISSAARQPFAVTILTLDGRKVFAATGDGPVATHIQTPGPGTYLLRYTAQRSYTQKIVIR
jgi:hypothetical protein